MTIKKLTKTEFYENKKVTSVDDIDANKILVSKKEPYATRNSFKYFIGYNQNYVIRPLCVRLSRKFDENKAMFLRVNN